MGKIAPVYLVWEGEILLDAPIEEAWRHVIDYPSWQNYSLVEHVSGTPGAEGEVMLLKKEESGELAPYHARTIKLEPGRQIVWKVYSPQRTPENDFFGIVDFKVYEAQGKTRFCYSSVHEFMVPYHAESELEVFRKQLYAGAEAFFAAVLPKLKQLIDRRA